MIAADFARLCRQIGEGMIALGLLFAEQCRGSEHQPGMGSNTAILHLDAKPHDAAPDPAPGQKHPPG